MSRRAVRRRAALEDLIDQTALVHHPRRSVLALGTERRDRPVLSAAPSGKARPEPASRSVQRDSWPVGYRPPRGAAIAGIRLYRATAAPTAAALTARLTPSSCP